MPNGTSGLALIDTNVLIDAADPREQDKAVLAADLLERLIATNRAVVSVQIVVEYFDNLTRRKGRLAPLMDGVRAARAVDWLLSSVRCLDLTPVTAFMATRASERYGMRVFDAHVWSAAFVNGIDLIITADVPGRNPIEGVRYVNPFGRGFTLAQLGL